MRIMFKLRVLGSILLVLSVLSLQACSRNKAEELPLEVGLGATSTVNPEQVNRNQPDIRMTAFWGEGAVQVQIQNRTTKRLEVGPANFAVIIPTSKTGGKRRLIPVEPGKVVLDFPVTQLDPNGVASGRFRFRELGNLQGCNLVFKNDDKSIRPSVCRIEAQKVPAPDSTDAPADAPADAAAKK
jgi:hypothetical protein